MSDLTRKILAHPKAAAGVLCILVITAAAAFVYMNFSAKEVVVTEDVQIETVDMKQSITAAGEVVTAEEENIAFSTSYYFKAMCVEEGEQVSKGQHLILYSNGTYEDAPADGFVTAINAPATGTVASSSNYLTFAYSDKMMIDITVPEGEINEVSQGDEAEIVVNSDTSKVFTGKISKKKALSTTLMSSSESSNTRSGQSGESSSPFGSESSTAYYTVSLTFDNDGSILPGMSAICTITISEKKDVMAVPIEAVQFNDDGEAYVLVLSDTGTEEVAVTTGDSDADYVEITEGLEGDETVRIERKG